MQRPCPLGNLIDPRGEFKFEERKKFVRLLMDHQATKLRRETIHEVIKNAACAIGREGGRGESLKLAGENPSERERMGHWEKKIMNISLKN